MWLKHYFIFPRTLKMFLCCLNELSLLMYLHESWIPGASGRITERMCHLLQKYHTDRRQWISGYSEQIYTKYISVKQKKTRLIWTFGRSLVPHPKCYYRHCFIFVNRNKLKKTIHWNSQSNIRLSNNELLSWCIGHSNKTRNPLQDVYDIVN